MSMIHTYPLENQPDNSGVLEGFAGNFDRFSQSVFELLDNATSNYFGHPRKEKFCIRIELVNEPDGVQIAVADNGTGILDLNNALRLAGKSGRESVLNGHGLGGKNVIATLNPENDNWSITTRTEEDARKDEYQVVRAPYGFSESEPMQVEVHSGSGDIIGRTGTIFRIGCNRTMFATMRVRRGRDGFFDLVQVLKEEIAYTYADILAKGDLEMELVATDGAKVVREVLQPMLPQWMEGTLVRLPETKTNFGGGSVKITCEYGSIVPDRHNALYYRGNMRSSGVEIRMHGRVIEKGLYERIWNDALHPNQNRFLARINLETENLQALPDTRTSKNGFREGDPRLEALYSWIASNVKRPSFDKATTEQKLFRALAEKLGQDEGVTRVALEEDTYRSLGLGVKIDMLLARSGDVTVYEGKARASKALDLYQLAMYLDGCAEDGIIVQEGVLIAPKHSRQTKVLVEHLNRLREAAGRKDLLRLTTWMEEGIDYPQPEKKKV